MTSKKGDAMERLAYPFTKALVASLFTTSDVVDSTAGSDPSMPLTCGTTVSGAISEAMIGVVMRKM
jgi:hypothetical protein